MNLTDYSKKHFLIVSNRSIIRVLIKQILKKNGFTNHSFARNGHDAFQIVQKHKTTIDVIISDWDMPIINGIEMLKDLKNNPTFFMMPFMLLSADTSGARQVYAIEESADIFLNIPFTENEIITSVKNCLAYTHQNTPEKNILNEMIRNNLIKNYDEVLNLGDKLKNKKEFAKASLLTGESLYHSKKYEQAKQVLNQYLVKEKHSKAYDLLGKIHSKQGEQKASLKYFELAQKHNPINIERTIKLASTYFANGKNRAALELTEDILNSSPSYLDMIKIADLYLEKGYVDRAYAILKLVNPIKETSRVYYLCTVRLWQKRQHKQCIDFLIHCINILPQCYLFQYHLGIIFLRAKRFDKAKKYILITLELNSDYEPAWRCLNYLESIYGN